MNGSSAIHDLSSVRRIVVRGVNWLGDAVMTTPALLRLRDRFPKAHIAILTPEKLRDLWLHHPAVDEVVAINSGEGVLSTGRKLRAGHFDLAVVLPNSPRSAIEPWLARIPQRVGYERPWRNFFLTTALPSPADRTAMRKRSVEEIGRLIAEHPRPPASRLAQLGAAHQTNDYLQLVGALGADSAPLAPALAVTETELIAGRKKFGLAEGQRIFGLNPGAEYGPAKRWPLERFIAAAREIQQQTNCTWVILGGKGDVALADEIERSLNSPPTVHNLAGRTSLRELCAVLKLCEVVLTNDTGPMHLAAALGARVVVPFGSTSPELTGPGMPGDSGNILLQSTAPCSPCFLRECPIDFRCMKGISMETVVASALKVATDVRRL